MKYLLVRQYVTYENINYIVMFWSDKKKSIKSKHIDMGNKCTASYTSLMYIITAQANKRTKSNLLALLLIICLETIFTLDMQHSLF